MFYGSLFVPVIKNTRQKKENQTNKRKKFLGYLSFYIVLIRVVKCSKKKIVWITIKWALCVYSKMLWSCHTYKSDIFYVWCVLFYWTFFLWGGDVGILMKNCGGAQIFEVFDIQFMALPCVWFEYIGW